MTRQVFALGLRAQRVTRRLPRPGVRDAPTLAAPPAAREDFTTFLTDPSMNPEGTRIADCLEQVLAAPGFGDRPTEIL